MRLGVALAMVMVLFAIARAAGAETRIALVIGNGDYWDLPLRNPANDARLMGETLRGLGFEVTTLVDLDQNAMKQAILDFGEKLERDYKNTVGLFYYAGHGVQVNGTNYLIPIDAKIRREADVEVVAVNANWVLGQMEFAGNPLNIVVLDACRNNPYQRSFRNSQTGLARMSAPRGTMIAYATRPGDVSSDGAGDNSPYTEALAQTIRRPGLSLSDVFIEVRNDVMDQTDGKQVPWEEGGLTGRFYFKPGPPQPAPPAAAAAPPSTPQPSPEVVFWQSVVDSEDPAAFEAYLAQFPDGLYAGLARMKIAALGAPPDAGRAEAGAGTQTAALAPPPPPAASPPAPAGPAPGDRLRDCPECPELVVVPAGTFMMGSDPADPASFENERPRHQVRIPRPFAVGRTEVTIDQFAAFVAATGHRTGQGCHRRDGDAWRLDAGLDWSNPGYPVDPSHPVACVSWQDAQAYVAWLTSRTGRAYRLLSEAEWEYAARAGAGTGWSSTAAADGQCAFANGADQASRRHHDRWTVAACNDGHPFTAPAGSFPANRFGLQDMLGNVSEWLADCWNENYAGAPADGRPRLTGDCSQRLRRGGSWTQTGSALRPADRHREGIDFRDYDNGFRIARPLD